MLIHEDERCDKVNDSISLIQKPNGLLFGTDALLLAAYINGKYKHGIELGGGTGIISLLLLARNKIMRASALEAQEEFANLITRNAELNGLSERLVSINSDIRDFSSSDECDIVFTNPPYMKTGSGAQNYLDIKNIARHEVLGGIYDFCHAGKRFLKFGGTFAAVYRPDRMIDLFDAMRKNEVEPKKMTLVFADTESEPSMVLVVGKRGGKPGLITTKPLIIYCDKEHKKYTRDMDFIMENGSFPDEYKR